MKRRNLSITLQSARQLFADNVAAILVFLAVSAAMAITFLNPDSTATEEFATVTFVHNTPDKYSAIDHVLFAKLSDGRTINMTLPQGWVPPMAGKQIRVKRIRKLFFGDRFVLLAAH